MKQEINAVLKLTLCSMHLWTHSPCFENHCEKNSLFLHKNE